jgi:hypothetical protein
MQENQIQQARRNEHTYRQLYSKLLRDNKNIFDDNTNNKEGNDAKDVNNNTAAAEYAEEQAVLETVFQNERNAFFASLGVAAVVFGTLRFGPRFLVRQFGSVDKNQAFQMADEQAQKVGTAETQTAIGKRESAPRLYWKLTNKFGVGHHATYELTHHVLFLPSSSSCRPTHSRSD